MRVFCFAAIYLPFTVLEQLIWLVIGYICMMYKAIINDGRTLSLTPLSDGGFDVDAKQISPDVVEIKEGVFHIILDNKSYNAEVIKTDSAEKTFHIKVNNHIYKICLQTRYDELLKELGMDSSRSKKVSEMKAPMPGMVVEVAVEEGQEVKKGDRILVLEAMKMENILKCPADGIVKKVKVIKGNTVEKNEVLVTFV